MKGSGVSFMCDTQFQSVINRNSRLFRCLMPLRLMSNSSRETTYLGKLYRMLWSIPCRSIIRSKESIGRASNIWSGDAQRIDQPPGVYTDLDHAEWYCNSGTTPYFVLYVGKFASGIRGKEQTIIRRSYVSCLFLSEDCRKGPIYSAE